jgi:serine/threonine protein kinase
MSYMEKGDLFEWIRKNGRFTEVEGKYFAAKIIETFRYLSNNNIFHRDIKPENILIGDNF